MVRGSNPVKIQEWHGRFTRYQKSNVSVVQFCEAECVSVASFYQWKRKLRDLDPPASTSDSAAKRTSKDSSDRRTDQHRGFQQVQWTALPPLATPRSALTVSFPGGIQVQVADHLPAIEAVMRELIHAQELLHAQTATKSGESRC